ncbi:uncharacterized protein [Miscanthus floridulus]|uniref:uncharacterized protein n=1 Tax=Miscanthus floridulus TaxID=154761 RepID=UPI00345993A9
MISLAITNVYGPSDHSLTDQFLTDLTGVASSISAPWLLIGDFNLTRSPSDKNNANFNFSLASRFNQTIDALQLFELPLLDRLFTWTNKRASPTLARLDRAFICTGFGELYPSTTLTSGHRPTSDHTPIIATIQSKIPKPSAFRLERSWLLDPSYLPAALLAWHSVPSGDNEAAVLVAQIKVARQASKVWLRKHRSPPHLYHNCYFIIRLLDYLEEFRPLIPGERCLRDLCSQRLELYLCQRAAYWKQRAKFRALKEGDANTKFFHARASGRRRKNQIATITVDGVQLITHQDKSDAMTAYYTSILGITNATSWNFDLSTLYNSEDLQILDDLILPFTEAEALLAVKSMNVNSAPGPDGFGPACCFDQWLPGELDYLQERHPAVDGPCPVLQYADDTLLLVRAEIVDIRRLKVTLDSFAMATGLKINYSKSTLVPMHVPQDRLERIVWLLQCQQASFPQVYLGLPLSNVKLNLAAFAPLISKVDRRLSGW